MSKIDAEDFISIVDDTGSTAKIQLHHIVEWMNEGIFCIDGDGKLLFANNQFCRNLGYTKAEIIGKNIFSFYFNTDFERNSRQKLEFRKKGLSDMYETKMRKKSGEGVWLRVNGKPIFNSQGKFVCSVGIQFDISQQKKLEEELMEAKADLESKIISRTRELSEANQKLNDQIKAKRLAEVSLRQSEKRFQNIYLNSPDAIYVQSYEGIILDCNESTCKLHDMKYEELIGKSIYDLAPKEIHELIRERQQHLISGQIKKFESECVDTNGIVIPIEISVAQTRFNDKPSLLMHVRDISDRKKHREMLERINQELEEKVNLRTSEIASAHNALEKQSAFLSQIIDSAPGLIFVKDAQGRYLMVNETMAEYHNLTKEEMVGKRDQDFELSTEDIELFNSQDNEVLETKKEMMFPEQVFYNEKTGEEHWLSVVKKMIPSLDNNGYNILGVASDVTEIKRAKQEIRISEQLYREIARNLPKAAMFIFDKDFRYILAEGPLVGEISKPKNEIEGKTIFDTFSAQDAEGMKAIYAKILEGENSEFEQVFFERTMRVHHIPIRNESGQIVYGMVMAFDISDLKATQQEVVKQNEMLQRSNAELERFAYVASHDLQGPLRTIASYLQLLELRNRDKLDAESKEFVDFSVNGAKRMQALIQDLLSYSKISSSPKPFVQVNLPDVVSIVLKNLDESIKSRNAEVVVQNLPVVQGDTSQLLQLLQNLIDNGLKFVRDRQPKLLISGTENPSHWTISVKDNGIGIREDYKERIFQIFQRLHTDAEYTGTGIGLAICKKIVHLHGGQIWFESVPGESTTFHFTISKEKKQ